MLRLLSAVGGTAGYCVKIGVTLPLSHCVRSYHLTIRVAIHRKTMLVRFAMYCMSLPRHHNHVVAV
jgi:hypothetical protein